MSLDDFRIVVAHGSRAHDDVRMSDIFSSVTFEDFNTHVLQAIGDVRAFQIRAGDTKAEIHQHLGNAGHADAAYPDKMNVLNASKHYVDRMYKIFSGFTCQSFNPVHLGL